MIIRRPKTLVLKDIDCADLKIRAGRTPEDYRNSLLERGIKIGVFTDKVLSKISGATTDHRLNVVRVSGTQLGFKNYVARTDIYRQAETFGLKKLPAHVAFEFRERYRGCDAWIIVASESFADPFGDQRLFSTERDTDGFWLRMVYDDPEYLWNPERLWLFERTSKVPR